MSTWDEVTKGNSGITKLDIDQFIDRCSKSKLFFAKHMCGLELSGKQPELIESMTNKQNVIAVFNRQGGKSTTLAVDDAHDLLFKTYPDGHEEWIIIYAPVQRQAEIIFGKVLHILEKNPIEDITQAFMKYHNKTGNIEMFNGNRLNARTASPNANIRGESPTKIQIDESQGVSDQQYYEAIIPSGSTTDAKIQEIGTPAGRNHFYRTFHKAEGDALRSTRYKTILQTWRECPFISKSYIAEQMSSMPEKSFKQEYECVWDLDEGFAWDYESIINAQIMPPENIPPEPKVKYVAGMDVAKKPAETVLVIFKVTPMNTLQQVFMDKESKTDWPEILSSMVDGVMTYKPSFMCFDRTGIGDAPFDFFKREVIRRDPDWKTWTKKYLEDVVYTNKLKGEMVADVDMLLHQNKFTKADIENRFGNVMNDEANDMIYQNALTLSSAESIKNQMSAFQSKRSESGFIKFFSEKGLNNDICNAIMLAVRAWKNLYGKRWITKDMPDRKVIAYGKPTRFAEGGRISTTMGTRLPKLEDSPY